MRRDVRVRLPLIEPGVRLPVIDTDGSGYVVVDPRPQLVRQVAAHPTLEHRCPTWSRAVRKPLLPLSSRHGRKVTDRVAERHQLVGRIGPQHRPTTAQTGQQQPRAVLRHAIPEAPEDLGVDRVSEVAERLEETGQHRAVIPGGEIGHVLHQHRVRPKTLDNLHERTPQQRSRILRVALTGSDQLAELRLAGTRERLARNATGDQLHMLDPPAVQLLEQLPRIAQIPDVAEPADIGRVRLDSPRVSVGADDHREARVPQTERESARTAEHVHRTRLR